MRLNFWKVVKCGKIDVFKFRVKRSIVIFIYLYIIGINEDKFIYYYIFIVNFKYNNRCFNF